MAFAASTKDEARILEAGPHDTVWQTVRAGVDDAGASVWSTNSFVELAVGLNCWSEESGRYEEFQESFQVTPQGYAVPEKRPYRLIIAPHINEPGSVDLWAPGGTALFRVLWRSPEGSAE